MANILSGDSDLNKELKLNPDTNYVQKIDEQKKKMEELKEMVRARYREQNAISSSTGKDNLFDDSCSSSDEDEVGIELTPQVEKNFFHALACLKRDDSSVYDKNHKFFEDRDESALGRAKATKPMFLREFQRRHVVEHGGYDEVEDNPDAAAPRPQSPSMAQEQQNLLVAIRTAVESDSDAEELLAPRARKQEEVEAEKDSYAEWLRGKGESLDNKEEEEDLKPLRDYWTNPKLTAEEEFLKNYVLGKPYMASEKLQDNELKLSDDERVEEKMDDFERRFNFRFEEPDAQLIKTFPRTMEASVRKKDTRRKEKREATKIRRKARREAKVQEMMQLKALKRKEIRERIEALKKATGNDSLGLQDSDIEGDFDPGKHDLRMEKMYNNPFYNGDQDEEKPEFSDLGDDSDFDHEPQAGGYVDEDGVHCEDAEFNMDADYDPATAPVKSKHKHKRQQQGKETELWDELSKPRPHFDPAKGSFDAYIDEYYQMDFEDIIEDLPCRFKYRNVMPNDFGLTIEEILLADDKELNKWAPLRKTMGHRPYWLEHKEQITYKNQAKNEEYKRKILASLYKDPEDNEADGEPGVTEKKRKKAGGKKKRKAEGRDRTEVAGHDEYGAGDEETGETKKKKKKKRKHSENDLDAEQGKEQAGVENEFEHQNGDPKKKKKKKRKHSENDLDAEQGKEQAGVENEFEHQNGDPKKKKKKKRKHSENDLDAEQGKEQAGVENEFEHQNGDPKKKKKKKRKHSENGVGTEEGTEQTGAENEIEHQNGETTKKKKKKKKRKHSENGVDAEDEVEHAVIKNELENKETAGEQSTKQGKAKKRKREEEEKSEENNAPKGELSRRKRRNLKLLEKRETGDPTCSKKKKKKKPRYRERDVECRNRLALAAASAAETSVKMPAEKPFSKDRLLAYGLTRPKRFLDYLKYKDFDAPLPERSDGSGEDD